MNECRNWWLRGVATLAVVGVLASALAVSPVGAALSRKKVKKIAGRLDASIAGRVAYAVDATLSKPLDPGSTGNPVVQLIASMAAPEAGFLVIEGSIDSRNFVTPDPYTCALSLDGQEVPSSRHTVTLATDDQTDCSTTTVLPIAAGAHTVVLIARGVNSADTLSDHQVLHATYVPYDGTGARPTSFGIA